MTNVVELPIWTTDKVECTCCKHRWVAVYIHGLDSLECPECGEMTEVWVE
jgi:hypothetical protein